MGNDIVSIPYGEKELLGELTVPDQPVGVVIFAHGSGSSRHSPRNREVADALRARGLGTLLMDLLTAEEEHEERYTRHHRFDIHLLANRLLVATDFVKSHTNNPQVPIGYFGASTGAAAALAAAAQLGDAVGAVVSRGGRPDLAGATLAVVTSPTLLIVGSEDGPVIGMNRDAMAKMASASVRMEIVPGATHLFAEPGALERVAELAGAWFAQHLTPAPAAAD
ncbi:MAG: alpha/beta hydrolase [bacterium]|nr:alpha/beta hydrolase [bacterium]